MYLFPCVSACLLSTSSPCLSGPFSVFAFALAPLLFLVSFTLLPLPLCPPLHLVLPLPPFQCICVNICHCFHLRMCFGFCFCFCLSVSSDRQGASDIPLSFERLNGRRVASFNSSNSISSSRQASMGPGQNPQESNSSSSNNTNTGACSEGEEQSVLNLNGDDEATYASAAAAAANQGDPRHPGALPGFVHWLARLEILEALRCIFHDDASFSINSSAKIEAMLVLKVQQTSIAAPVHACTA